MGNDWKFDHVGMTVEDLDKGVKHFQSLGFVLLGEPVEKVWNSPSMAIKIKEAVLHKGAFTLKLHQSVEGKGLQADFIDKHGEGIYYMGFVADDLDWEKAEMVERGFPVLQSVKGKDGTLLETYHDTRKFGGVIVALVLAPTVAPKAKGTSEDTWRLEHVGFIVRDINKTIDFYKSMGFSVMFPTVALFSGETAPSTTLTPSTKLMKMCVVKKSSFAIELFETFGGSDLWSTFLEEHGEGINHLSFAVDNLEKENSKILDKGFQTSNVAKKPDGSLYEIYYDTSKVGNVQICLYQGDPRLSYESTMRALMLIGCIVGRDN